MAILIISVALGVLIVLFGYVLLSPNVSSETFVLGQDSQLDPSIRKALNFFGGDIAMMIPKEIKKKNRQSHRLKRLFITSANPWGLDPTEFLITQVFLGGSAFILSIIASVVLKDVLSPFLTVVAIVGMTALGFFYPQIFYKSVADDRMKAFKKELPEALDFLIIAMSGGRSGLPMAIEQSTKYIPEGVMNEEFRKITAAMDAGKPQSVALDEFAERAPTEGIRAFANSLNNASQQSAPVIEILRNRSEASRKELNAEIDKKIATLGTKVFLVFGPMAYIAVLLVVMAPVASTLAQLL